MLGPHIVRTIDKGDDFLCEKNVSGQAHFCYIQFDKQYHLGERNVIPYPVSKMHLFEAATHLNVVVFSTEQQ